MAQVADVVTFARGLLNSVGGSSARLTDATAINFCDRATKAVVEEILFPDSRLTLTTIPNQQAYSLPEVHIIKRVYLAGQLVVPTSLYTLEGSQALVYDQSGTGAPIAGNDAAPGTLGVSAPAWAVQAPVAYPFVNNWGEPAPTAQPWFPGQRPRYYLRGGLIGLVPAPANAVSLVVDCVAIPPKAINLTDTLVAPDNFIEPIAWKMCTYVKFSDDTDRASDGRNYASQEYTNAIRRLRTWVRTYTGDESGPKIRTYRGDYRIGTRRAGDGDF